MFLFRLKPNYLVCRRKGSEMNIFDMKQCPKCHGTTRIKIPEKIQKFKKSLPTYDDETDTISCDNCGYQYGATPVGIVKTNRDGQPCLHQYRKTTIGRCYAKFTCNFCDDFYEVDSGD